MGQLGDFQEYPIQHHAKSARAASSPSIIALLSIPSLDLVFNPLCEVELVDAIDQVVALVQFFNHLLGLVQRRYPDIRQKLQSQVTSSGCQTTHVRVRALGNFGPGVRDLS